MTAYLRLLLLRTRRTLLPMSVGLTALGPIGILVAATGIDRLDPGLEQLPVQDAFVMTCFAVIAAAVLTTANLTAFLVHDERRGGRARLLRLASIDGRCPVGAHLALAGLVAGGGVLVGLAPPGLYAVARGLPLVAWLGAATGAAALTTAAGALGLWAGYLLPRTAALVAIQMAGLWIVALVGGAVSDLVMASAVPLRALAWVGLVHLLTLLLLSPLWRRTSRSLW